MAGNDEAKVAAVASTAAAIAAGLALLNSRRVEAGEPVIPDELIQLIVALAASSEDIKSTTLQILQALGVGGQGWPANADSITSLRVAINPPAGIQLPSIVVPSGFALVISAWPLNPAWVFVAPSLGEVSQLNQAYPLLPTGNVSYFVENADQLYVSGMTPGGVPTAGCFACLTVEQRRRGGG